MTVEELCKRLIINIPKTHYLRNYKLEIEYIKRSPYPNEDQIDTYNETVIKFDIDNNNKTITLKGENKK